MAFSTIQGSGGAPDSFVGTSGVDSIVFEGNTNNFFLGAQEANDYIGFDNVGALQTGTYTNGTLRGGAGSDNFQDLAFGVNIVSSWLNGNSDDDTFGSNVTGLRLISSTLQGGQGDDTMFVNGASNSLFNGNKDDDTLAFTGVITASTIGGGQGDDTLTQAAGSSMTGTSLLLGDGVDTFAQAAGALATDFGAGNTIEGGDGNDTITLLATTAADAVINGGAGTDAISAGAGDDTLNGGAGNDAITGFNGADTMTGGGGANAFIYTTVAQSGNVTTGAVDVITDFTTGTDTIDQSGAFTIDGAQIGTGLTAVTATTYAGALAAVNALAAAAADSFAVVAVGSGSSFTSYLMGMAAGAAVDFAVQIGETGAYATAAQAQAAFAGTDFTA